MRVSSLVALFSKVSWVEQVIPSVIWGNDRSGR